MVFVTNQQVTEFEPFKLQVTEFEMSLYQFNLLL